MKYDFFTNFYLKSAIQTKDVIREETHFGVAHHIFRISSVIKSWKASKVEYTLAQYLALCASRHFEVAQSSMFFHFSSGLFCVSLLSSSLWSSSSESSLSHKSPLSWSSPSLDLRIRIRNRPQNHYQYYIPFEILVIIFIFIMYFKKLFKCFFSLAFHVLFLIFKNVRIT